jgi:predicted TIM-barrel fold metal-dependent hydrolase
VIVRGAIGCLVLAVALAAPTRQIPAPPAAAGGRDTLAPAADHHQHLVSPTVASGGRMEALEADRLIALLDAAGIDKAAILSLAYSYGNPNRETTQPRSIEREQALVIAENDWTSAQVARFPSRLRAFCSVNPLRPYALDEIARCARDPQLRTGLKLHFGNSDVRLDVVEHVAGVRQVFAAANRHRMAIVVHLRSTLSQQRPYGAASARAFLEQVLPEAPDVPVQIAHLAGAGGFDDPLVDEALAVFVEAIARDDPRMRRVIFDASGVAGLGDWKAKAPRIAARIRALGVTRVYYGSDAAGGGNMTPAEAWRAFTELPLTDAEIREIAGHVAPYVR